MTNYKCRTFLLWSQTLKNRTKYNGLIILIIATIETHTKRRSKHEWNAKEKSILIVTRSRMCQSACVSNPKILHCPHRVSCSALVTLIQQENLYIRSATLREFMDVRSREKQMKPAVSNVFTNPCIVGYANLFMIYSKTMIFRLLCQFPVPIRIQISIIVPAGWCLLFHVTASRYWIMQKHTLYICV